MSNQSAQDIAAAVHSGATTARLEVEAALNRISSLDSDIHAFVRVDPDAALANADAIDQSETKGPLAGVPIAIKDNISVAGKPLTCGSRLLENFVAQYDATVVQRLQQAGAIVVGQTNMDEFAMGSSTERSAWFPTRNPWDHDRVPGGSSGGSAAAVAAGMVPLALGSDTGGSIRQPAAFCGITGFKPTYGAVSRYGLVAFASSLDQIGPMALDCGDVALCHRLIAGPDPFDATSLPESIPSKDTQPTDFSGTTIGVPVELLADGVESAVRNRFQETLEKLEADGATIREVSLPLQKLGIPVYYVIAPSEASSNLARYDGVHYGGRAKDADTIATLYERTRGRGFGPEVRRRIMLGTFALSSGYSEAYYRQAMCVRRMIADELGSVFNDIDVLLTPTTPTTAFPLEEQLSDPVVMYLNDMFTVTANLAGVPSLSLPAGTAPNGLPIGIQWTGPQKSDNSLLTMGQLFQSRIWAPSLAPTA